MSHKITEWSNGYGDCPTCGIVKVYTKTSRGKQYASCSVNAKAKGVANRKTHTNKQANLIRRYNMTLLEFEEMVKSQDGKCAICKRTTEKFVVDHDHACCDGEISCGDCVRGLLCNSCNTMLGFAGDNIQTLNAASKYLARAAVSNQYEG